MIFNIFDSVKSLIEDIDRKAREKYESKLRKSKKLANNSQTKTE